MGQKEYRTLNKQNQEKKSPTMHNNQNTRYVEQKKNNKKCKGKRTSDI